MEWSLHPKIFKWILSIWDTPHLDLFASCLNNKLPVYVSFKWMSCPCVGREYSPMHSLLDRVLKQIEERDFDDTNSSCMAQQDMVSEVTEEAMKLLERCNLLCQPRSDIFYSLNNSLNNLHLHAQSH